MDQTKQPTAAAAAAVVKSKPINIKLPAAGYKKLKIDCMCGDCTELKSPITRSKIEVFEDPVTLDNLQQNWKDSIEGL